MHSTWGIRTIIVPLMGVTVAAVAVVVVYGGEGKEMEFVNEERETVSAVVQSINQHNHYNTSIPL